MTETKTLNDLGSNAGLAITPASREGKTPLAMDAEIRKHMHGLCQTCAYASDFCKNQHRAQEGDSEFGGILDCGGYAMVNATELTCHASARSC